MKIHLCYLDGYYAVEVTQEECDRISANHINLLPKYKDHPHTPYKIVGYSPDIIIMDDLWMPPLT